MSVERIILRVDASYFPYDAGDTVLKGDTLGLSQGCPIVAPFRGTIQYISFDAEDHMLVVVFDETEHPEGLVESHV